MVKQSMSKKEEGQLTRRIVRHKSVRLFRPRIPPLKGVDLAAVMEKLIDKSEWDKVVQTFTEE